MKIYMQYERLLHFCLYRPPLYANLRNRIPWKGTELKVRALRKPQADSNRLRGMEFQIKALRQLTEHGSKHTPHLVSELHTKQGDDGVVPNGFLSYILMTWCPGVPLGEGDYGRKTKDEQRRIFQAFGEALE